MLLSLKRKALIGLAVITVIIITGMVSFAGTTNYTYDELNRLIKVEYENGTAINYTYDSAGNMLTLTADTGTATPTSTATITAIPTTTPITTPTVVQIPTPTPALTPTPIVTPTPTVTASPTPATTPTPTSTTPQLQRPPVRRQQHSPLLLQHRLQHW